jgi:hypothetical protein
MESTTAVEPDDWGLRKAEAPILPRPSAVGGCRLRAGADVRGLRSVGPNEVMPILAVIIF